MKKAIISALIAIYALQSSPASWAQLRGSVQQAGGATGLQGSAGAGGHKPLKGTVQTGRVGAVVIPSHIKLTREEYQAALQQYSGDVKDFMLSAAQYQAMVKQYKDLIGECNENTGQYALKVKKDQLNIQAIQIPNVPLNLKQFNIPPEIPPPRVCCANCLITGKCGHLGTGGAGPGAGTAQPNASRMDTIRLNESTQAVGKAQQSLKVAEAEQGFAQQKAQQEARIEAKMQKLADSFGQLQEKYNIIKIERDTLTGRVTVPK